MHAQKGIRSMYRSHHKGKWNEHENQYILYITQPIYNQSLNHEVKIPYITAFKKNISYPFIVCEGGTITSWHYMIQPRVVLHEQIIYKKTCFCTHWCTIDAVCLFSQLAVAFGRKTCWEVWRGFSVMQPRPSSHVDTFWGVLFAQTPVISFLNAAFGQPRHQKSPANTTGPGMNLFNKTRSYKHETRSSQKLIFWPQNVAPFYVVVAVWICLTIIDKKQPTPNGCFQKSWYPKMDGENNGKPYEQMDDLGVPLFLETPK